MSTRAGGKSVHEVARVKSHHEKKGQGWGKERLTGELGIETP
jgi:hypothetical protein